MKTVVYLKKSTNPNKKYMVMVEKNNKRKIIHFGARGMSDYTKHKDKNRMHRYSARHKRKESWSKSGVMTAGFWSKWLLWNKPSFQASKNDIAKRFNVTFRKGWPNKKSNRKSKRKSRKSKRKSKRKSRKSKRKARKSRKAKRKSKRK